MNGPASRDGSKRGRTGPASHDGAGTRQNEKRPEAHGKTNESADFGICQAFKVRTKTITYAIGKQTYET